MEPTSEAALPTSFGGRPLATTTGNGAALANGPATARAADLAAARIELTRPVELPPEGRLSAATLATLAAAAGVVAILVGGWAFVAGLGKDAAEPGATAATAPAGYGDAVAVLSEPGAELLRLRGSVGRIVLVVGPAGDAALVLNGLGIVDSGWAYQAWVSRPNGLTPRSAALFSGREAVVPLTAPVPPGATVAVTLEPEAGSFAPTRTPKLSVQRPA
jgi:hypothetical protein